jgi:hypothetical protein
LTGVAGIVFESIQLINPTHLYITGVYRDKRAASRWFFY